jgi:hypothetical protein
MSETLWAVVRDGRIELVEPVKLPEGAKLKLTLVSDEDQKFWLDASQSAIDSVWGNAEDDVYAQLLEK